MFYSLLLLLEQRNESAWDGPEEHWGGGEEESWGKDPPQKGPGQSRVPRIPCRCVNENPPLLLFSYFFPVHSETAAEYILKTDLD